MENRFDFEKSREALLLKKIIKENKIPQELSYSDFRKFFIREGFSATTAYNYCFTLVACEIVTRIKNRMIIQTKFYESALQ